VNKLLRGLMPPASALGRDEADIRRVAVRQDDAWSRYDAMVYGALFTEVVTKQAVRWQIAGSRTRIVLPSGHFRRDLPCPQGESRRAEPVVFGETR
jgi:hypothetical protein